MYSWCKAIDDYHEEVNKPCCHEKIKDQGLKYIAIDPFFEIDVFKSKRCSLNTVEFSWHMSVVGKYHCEITGKTNEFENISVGGFTLDELADLPVVIKNTANVERKNLSAQEYTKEVLHENSSVDISLLEFLDCIYFEISFYGSPKERDENSEEIFDKLDSFDHDNEK